jgi:hypothetical protein
LIATGEIEDNLKEKDLIKLAASAMERKGGLKGDNEEPKHYPKRRSEIPKMATTARWRRTKNKHK